MYFQKKQLVLMLTLGLILSIPPIFSPAVADLVRIDSKGVFTAISPEAYRKKLLALQTSPKVCSVKFGITHQNVYVSEKGVTKLTPQMLAVIYKMHMQLEHDRTFRHHVAGLIERDLEDVKSALIIPTEVGGLGLLAEGTIELLPIPRSGRLQIKAYRDRFGNSVTVFGDNNRSYRLPPWARKKIPHILEFHLHAISNEKADIHCSPSFGFGRSKNGLAGDIGYAIHQVKKQMRIHEFVFAKLKGRTFSVVYYGGEKKHDGSWFISVVALPNIKY